MNNYMIEIRAGAGGKESISLCESLASVYIKYCKKNSMDVKIVDNNSKTLTLLVDGKNADIFLNEVGIHKFQRVAVTEKNGRIQTSTVSVAVLRIPDQNTKTLFNESDLKITKFHCGGKGGQNVNKVETGIRIEHIPSGIVVKGTTERTQNSNKESALKILSAKLNQMSKNHQSLKQNNERLNQVKTGDRAEARRIYNEQRGEIVDRVSNKTCKYKDFFKGNIENLK